jgi:hypothetical protein
MAIAAITFDIPLSALLDADRPARAAATRLVWVRATAERPAPREGQRTASATPGREVSAPPPRLTAPSAVPTTIPLSPPSAAVAGVVGVPGGTGTAATSLPGSATNPKLGLEPALPDPRISLQPVQAEPVLRTMAMKNDSVVQSAYAEFRDSVLAHQANKGRAPGDWTIDRDGQKWGWDPKGIRLGKFTIPNAILAAMPLNIGPQGRNINALTDVRMQSWTQRDLDFHSRAMSDADFKAAVKRIRERVDRERAAQGKPGPTPPPVKIPK